MAVTHDAPKELDQRSIAWSALIAGKPVGIQLLTGQLNNWLSAVHNTKRYLEKHGGYVFSLPEDKHGPYLPIDGERNLILSDSGKLEILGIHRSLKEGQQVIAHLIVHGDRQVGYDIRIKNEGQAIRLCTKNGLRRNPKYTVTPTQRQARAMLIELLGGESPWL